MQAMWRRLRCCMLSCMLLRLFVCSAAHRLRGASSSNLSLFIDLHGSPDVDVMQTSFDAVNHTDTHTDTGTASSLDFGVQQKRSDDFSNQRQTMIRKYQSFLGALKEDIHSSHEHPLTPLQSLPSGLRDGKLAYVFILQDRLPFASLWEKYFDMLPNNSWAAYVHYSSKETARDNQIPFSHKVIPHQNSSWCRLVPMMMAGLETAMQDQDVYGLVFISGSTLPIKTPAHIHRRLGWSNSSIFKGSCDDTYCHVSQWSYMRRDDVKLVIESYNNGVGRELVRVLEEEGGPPMEPSKGLPVSLKSNPGCSDEKYFVYVIYTTYEARNAEKPYVQFNDVPIYLLWSNDKSLVENGIIFDHNPPATFAKMPVEWYEKMRDSESLFARKFVEESTVCTFNNTQVTMPSGDWGAAGGEQSLFPKLDPRPASEKDFSIRIEELLVSTNLT